MTTISAKELRTNLSDYLKRAMNGEEIEVIYRSKPAVKIQSATVRAANNSAAVSAAIREYNQKVKLGPAEFATLKSSKDNYHDLLDKDVKYKSR